MNHYDTKFIKQYIEDNKERIDYVECGMKEDWNWTAETVYEDGQFCKEFKWERDRLEVAHIDGSYWASPIMLVHLKNGNITHVECWVDDGIEAERSDILQRKLFAAATGGMDFAP